jgi:outer membrane immunogenic protein
MKHSFLAASAAAFVLAGSQVLAADLPTRAPVYKAQPAYFSWTGFYIGANAGWGRNDDDGAPFCINPGGVLNGNGCRTTNVPGAQIRSDGGFVGGQIGYNVQNGMFVWGVEADFQGSDIKDSISIPGPFATVGGGAAGGTRFDASHSMDWFGTVRARLGLAAYDRALIYATGGLIYGRVQVSQNTVFPNTQYASTLETTRTGWTAGGGIEFAFAPNWSGKLEALYYDMGSVSTQAIGSPTIDSFIGGKTFDLKGGLVRAGINYRFGWY